MISAILLICSMSILSLEGNSALTNVQPLKVSANGRFLVDRSNNPVFINADTCWEIPWKLKKEEVDFYLDKRKEQKFNAIGVNTFTDEKTRANMYGEQPFEIINEKYDPLKPILNKKYSYWDHLNYIIDGAAKRGMYVFLLPTWGSRVTGNYRNGKSYSAVLFNETNAYQYAKWIAELFKNKNNVIWMLGGDRSAVYGKYDYRKVFDSLAKGLIAGSGNKKILISYHPRKWAPNSSEWFHNKSWLSFNSIQDGPIDQLKAIRHDWNLKPAKPTWLFEGGYERRTREGGFVYKDWQVRLQAYQTVFAGGFGETHGNMSIWCFAPDWKKCLNDPGANQLRHLVKLMSLWSKEQYLSRIPDQSLLIGNTGKMTGCEGMNSSCIVATRTKKGDLAMIYTAAGENLSIRTQILNGPKMHAYWYDPRSGKYKIAGKEVEKPTPFSNDIHSGKKALDYQFYVPKMEKEGNDWVLILSNEKL